LVLDIEKNFIMVIFMGVVINLVILLAAQAASGK